MLAPNADPRHLGRGARPGDRPGIYELAGGGIHSAQSRWGWCTPPQYLVEPRSRIHAAPVPPNATSGRPSGPIRRPGLCHRTRPNRAKASDLNIARAWRRRPHQVAEPFRAGSVRPRLGTWPRCRAWRARSRTSPPPAPQGGSSLSSLGQRAQLGQHRQNDASTTGPEQRWVARGRPGRRLLLPRGSLKRACA